MTSFILFFENYLHRPHVVIRIEPFDIVKIEFPVPWYFFALFTVFLELFIGTLLIIASTTHGLQIFEHLLPKQSNKIKGYDAIGAWRYRRWIFRCDKQFTHEFQLQMYARITQYFYLQISCPNHLFCCSFCMHQVSHFTLFIIFSWDMLNTWDLKHIS